MKKVYLQWVYFTDLQDALVAGFHDLFHLYAIFLTRKGVKGFAQQLIKGSELVYIGSTIQTPSERLLNNHAALISAFRDLGGDHYIEFAFGAFQRGPGATKTIDEELLRDVEAALIAFFKPRLNGVGVKEYKGQPLTIESECEDEKKLTFSLIYE